MAAPSSPSSSCEIVDLAEAATLDDAISKLFFSKGGVDDLYWPVVAKIASKLTNQESLQALCDKFGVPSDLRPVCAATLGCAACDTPTEGQSWNALCIYADALEAGLRFPMPVFYQKLLRHYNLAPSQLTPNSWVYMAAFLQLCEDARVEGQLVSAFTYFFTLCVHKHKHNNKPLGWYHFRHRAGRRRLFSGNLPTKRGWKWRFLFLKPSEGMPWRCPVAWGKPRREAVGIVELTDAAIKKLENMPCIDLQNFSTRRVPPVGALTLLQQHHTTAPMVKPESAAASAQALVHTTSLHQLPATLEAGTRAPSFADAAGEGDSMTWGTRRKRRCPCPGPASVTVAPPMPPSFAISAVPPLLQGLEMTPCETSFDGAWGSSEISRPPGIWPSDALSMYDAMVAMDAEKARLQENQQATDAKVAQEIAHLQGQLQQAAHREQQANAVIAKFKNYWAAARAENGQLKEKYVSEIAKLNQGHASEVAKLQEKHAAEVAKLNQAHVAAVNWLMEEHEVEVARLKHAAEEAVDVMQDAKKDIALALFPDLDASLL